jgi:hypothetical protein
MDIPIRFVTLPANLTGAPDEYTYDNRQAFKRWVVEQDGFLLICSRPYRIFGGLNTNPGAMGKQPYEASTRQQASSKRREWPKDREWWFPKWAMLPNDLGLPRIADFEGGYTVLFQQTQSVTKRGEIVIAEPQLRRYHALLVWCLDGAGHAKALGKRLSSLGHSITYTLWNPEELTVAA